MARIDQRRVPIALFAIAIALLAGRIAYQTTKRAPAAKAQGDLVQWVTPSEGVALARTSNKPVLYDFTAAWCGPCHVLDAQVFRDAQLAQEINARFIPVRVVDREREDGQNAPDVQELQDRYGVRGFPTVIFADASGVRARMEGFRGREYFEQMMRRVR